MISDISTAEKRPILDVAKIGQFSISVLVVYYMWYNEKYGHNTLVVYGSFLVMCACLLIDMLEDGELVFGDYHIGIWGNFAIVLYSFATGFFVAYSQSALIESLKLVLQYSVIAFATYHFAKKSEKNLEWFLITVNISALLCCYCLISNPVEIIYGRFSMSRLNNPNTLGFMLVIGLFSVVYRFRTDIKWLVVYSPQVIIMMYGIIQTGSRKAFIAAVILISLWTINALKEFGNTQKDWTFVVIVIAFAIVVFVGGRYIVSVYSQSRVAFRMENMLDDDSNGNRMNFYKLAWKIFIDKPFFGGGLDQYKFWSGIGGYAHSTYAEAIADFGFIGSIIYFAPILSTGFELIQIVKDDTKQFEKRLVLALWIVEIFMGIGQIFFYDIMHFFAWTIIYLTAFKGKLQRPKVRVCRYIR